MMGHGTMSIAALLSTAAVGYFVCVKASGEKKGSYLKGIGLALGSLIIIVSILGTVCLVAKKGYCPFTKKLVCKGWIEGHQHPPSPASDR